MALSAADMRLSNVAARLFTVGADLHAALESRRQWTGHDGAQSHEFTGVGAHDVGQRAGFAQVAPPALPRGREQAALLHRAAAKIIAIEVGAFSAGRGAHEQQPGAGAVVTRA